MTRVPTIHLDPLESRQLLSGYSIVNLAPPAIAVGLTAPTVAGISSDGLRIVGQATAGSGAKIAIVWAPARHGVRRVTVLPSLGGDASAVGVNDAGQVVGAFHLTSNPASATHACEWHFNKARGRYVAADLGVSVGGETGVASVANAINSDGEVVGAVTGIPDANGLNGMRGDAVAWTSGAAASAVNLSKTLHPTGTIGGGMPLDGPFAATEINDAGMIAGTLTSLGGMGAEAYVWRIAGGGAVASNHLGVGAAGGISADGAVAVNTGVGDNIGGNALLYRQVTRTKWSTTLIEAVNGGLHTWVSAMNAGGAAAGTTTVPNEQPNFVPVTVWRPRLGRMKGFELFAQIAAPGAFTTLNAVAGMDDAGDIVGSGQVGGVATAFLVDVT